MKTTVQKPLKNVLSILALTLLTSSLFAQKVANVQDVSVIAPPSVKVDGNLKEWDDSFQAYNKATKLSYTISNDDKYLYLAIKSIDPQTNNKIVAGGITFIINTQDKKKDKDAASITFPVIPRRQRGQGGQGGPGGGGPGGPGGFGGQGGGRGGAPTLDSAALATQHKQTIAAAKDIKIFGIKDVTDTLISIYNEFGIKAAIGYDPIGNYDYELAIPLKNLGLSAESPKEFAYDIKVNGITMPNFDRRDDGGGRDGGQGGGGGQGGAGGGGRGPGGGGGDRGPGGGGDRGGMMEMFSPTDFWGKYTLAKK